MSANIAYEIESALIQARDDAESITNWYQLRRQQALLELDRLETVYNERMADHSAQWSQRLYKLFTEPEMLEAGVASQIILPMPKLVRQTNLRSLPEYASLWDKSETDFEKLHIDFIDMPTHWDKYGMDFVNTNIDETIEIAIVSDDDYDNYDETDDMIMMTTASIFNTTASIFNTTAYEMC
jgi:hypothetical protein